MGCERITQSVSAACNKWENISCSLRCPVTLICLLDYLLLLMGHICPVILIYEEVTPIWRWYVFLFNYDTLPKFCLIRPVCLVTLMTAYHNWSRILADSFLVIVVYFTDSGDVLSQLTIGRVSKYLTNTDVSIGGQGVERGAQDVWQCKCYWMSADLLHELDTHIQHDRMRAYCIYSLVKLLHVY